MSGLAGSLWLPLEVQNQSDFPAYHVKVTGTASVGGKAVRTWESDESVIPARQPFKYPFSISAREFGKLLRGPAELSYVVEYSGSPDGSSPHYFKDGYLVELKGDSISYRSLASKAD